MKALGKYVTKVFSCGPLLARSKPVICCLPKSVVHFRQYHLEISQAIMAIEKRDRIEVVSQITQVSEQEDLPIRQGYSGPVGVLLQAELLSELLIQELRPRRLVLRISRNLQAAAMQLGLTDGQELLPGTGVAGAAPPEPAVHFHEDGLEFEAEVVRGQKTGFFLDQRENRRRIATLTAGAEVLNELRIDTIEGRWGFCDRLVINPDNTAHLFDWKFVRSKEVVDAEVNLQVSVRRPTLPCGNEAALAATRRGAAEVSLVDFTVAIERIVAGVQEIEKEDYTQRVPLSGLPELDRITSNLNRLTEVLAASKASTTKIIPEPLDMPAAYFAPSPPRKTPSARDPVPRPPSVALEPNLPASAAPE